MESAEIQKRLSENLRKIRKSKDLTQFELAVKCDISEAMVKNIELNRSWPSEKTLAQLTKGLEIDVSQLFLPAALEFLNPQSIAVVKKTLVKYLWDYINEQIQAMNFD